MAKTNIRATFEVLDGYFLNTGNFQLNKDYFLNNIWRELDDVFRTDKILRKQVAKTKKVTTLIWNAFMHMTNCYLENEGYAYRCTSEQLKKYLKQYGYGYEIFKPLYKDVEEFQEEIRKIDC